MEPEKQIPCPFVTAQKLLAGKWSILILHLLHGQTLRFGQLQKQMPKMTHATLSKQLKLLEASVLFCGTLLGMGILYLVFLGALGCLNEDTLQLLKRKRT